MFIDVDLDKKTQAKLCRLLRESIVKTFQRELGRARFDSLMIKEGAEIYRDLRRHVPDLDAALLGLLVEAIKQGNIRCSGWAWIKDGREPADVQLLPKVWLDHEGVEWSAETNQLDVKLAWEISRDTCNSAPQNPKNLIAS